MKKAATYKGKLGWQSEFDHHFACWAQNHNGWAKAKRYNKRVAKRRLKDEWQKTQRTPETIHCPTCGHHISIPFGETTGYCPLCDKEVKSDE